VGKNGSRTGGAGRLAPASLESAGKRRPAGARQGAQWPLLATGQLFDDPSADSFEHRRDPASGAKRLPRQSEAHGFGVSLMSTAA